MSLNLVRPRDSQRSKVYKWERSLQDSKLDLQGSAALVSRVFNDYGVVVPKVTDGRRRKNACYKPYSHIICLPVWARSDTVVLHECAHGLLEKIKPGMAWHGPEFMRLFLELLAHYKNLKISETSKSAREIGLKLGAAEAKTKRPSLRQKKETQYLKDELESVTCQINVLEAQLAELKSTRALIKTSLAMLIK